MKKLVLALIVAALATIAVAPAAMAAIEVEGDAYIGVYEKYLWRGFDLTGEADSVVQYGTDLSAKGFTLSWWGNHNTDTGNLDEVDVVLDYSFDLSEMISASVGNVLYDVDGAADTNELYLGVALNTILEPSLTAYYDYDEFEGSVYLSLGVGHSLDVAENVSVGFGAAANYYYMDDTLTGTGQDEDFAHNAELSLGVDYAVTDQVSISPSVLYSLVLSDDAEDIAGIDDEFTGGVSVALSF
ncbi:MAG: hypothetical protein R6V08_04110 [Desulfuromonadales bacterium]